MNPWHVITGVIIALAVYYRPWKYLPSGLKVPAWKWKHVFWSVLIVLVCLALLPQIVWAGSWLIALIASGPDHLIRGTPRSHWGIELPRMSKHTESLTQEVLDNNPILWDKSANVKLRSRTNAEPRDKNGSYFAGIIPPRSTIYATYDAYTTEKRDWDAFLIDYTSSGRHLPLDILKERGVTEAGKPVGVYRMPLLARIGRHVESFSNNSNDLLELYIQTSGNSPDFMQITHEEQENTYQYEVNVGLKETSFTIPHQDWKSAWIAPIHHVAYQASIDNLPVPAEGVSVADHKNHLAITLSLDGEKSVLNKALLLQPRGSGQRVKLVLNNVTEETLEGLVQPARIIVGIQL